MAPPIIPARSEETDGPDTQTVGRLLWEELHGDGMQQPAQLEWLPLQPPATTAAVLQSIIPMTLLPPLGFRHRRHLRQRCRLLRLGLPVPQISPYGASNEGDTVTLTGEQWQYYWPFMSNVWTRSSAYTAQKRKQTSRTHWNCHLCKSKAETSFGGGERNRQIRRTIGRCPAKLIEVHDIMSDIHLFLMDGCHSHSLASLDEIKINDGCKVSPQSQL
ncbi:hypothetical protein V8E54_006474 [Elaphomyces granulatus]